MAPYGVGRDLKALRNGAFREPRRDGQINLRPRRVQTQIVQRNPTERCGTAATRSNQARNSGADRALAGPTVDTMNYSVFQR